MPLNTSGPISLRGTTAGQSIQQELGLSGQISLLDSAVRTLAGVASGPITMPTNFYGKANAFIFNQTISSNTNDYNLRNAAIAAGWNQVLVLQATVTINSGVFVGSTSTGSAGFTTGSSFPVGSTLAIINNGSIVGRGGNGGGGNASTNFAGSGGGGGAGVVNSSGGIGQTGSNNGSPGGNTTGGSGGASRVFLGPPTPVDTGSNGNPGGNGGLALLVSYPTSIQNNGTIGGGGGGGGQGGGGFQAASPRSFGINAGGGAGGGLGSAGTKGGDKPSPSPGIGGAGGAAGAAVNGNSNITWLATGTRLGAIS
jgi:hypothetical protein